MRVALAASGSVTGALARLLRQRGQTVAAAAGVRVELVGVLAHGSASTGSAAVDPALVTADVDAFLGTSADVVVEAVEDAGLARQLATRTLSAGRRYVSASTSLVVEHGPELAARAAKAGTTFDFAAALPGCLPAVRLLRDGALDGGIHRIRGLLDATPDPTGHAAADKIAILAWLGFGADPRLLSVRRVELDESVGDLITLAHAAGGVLKQVAEAVQLPDGVIASVEPIVLRPRSRLAAARHGEVLVAVDGSDAEPVYFEGKEVGDEAVVSALLSDLVRPAGALRPGSNETLSCIPDSRLHRWLVPVPQRVVKYLWGSCQQHAAEGYVVVPAVERSGDTLVCLRCSVDVLDLVAADLSRVGAKVARVRWEQ